MENVYLVTFNGFTDGYGAEIYLLGIYDTEIKAKEALEELIKTYPELDEECSLREIKLNDTFKAEPIGLFNTITTDILLGGYCE